MQLRRIIQEAGAQVPDFHALTTIPQPVKDLSTIPTISPFMLIMLGETTASAARTQLNIVEHQSSQVITTASLANLGTETGVLTIPDLACDLIAIEVDRACWVTLYSTVAARSADSGRVLPTRPTAGTGVLAEFVLAGSGTTPGSPPPRLINGDGAGGAASASQVYYRIENMSGATSPVQVTFHFGALP